MQYNWSNIHIKRYGSHKQSYHLESPIQLNNYAGGGGCEEEFQNDGGGDEEEGKYDCQGALWQGACLQPACLQQGELGEGVSSYKFTIVICEIFYEQLLIEHIYAKY